MDDVLGWLGVWGGVLSTVLAVHKLFFEVLPYTSDLRCHKLSADIFDLTINNPLNRPIWITKVRYLPACRNAEIIYADELASVIKHVMKIPFIVSVEENGSHKISLKIPEIDSFKKRFVKISWKKPGAILPGLPIFARISMHDLKKLQSVR